MKFTTSLVILAAAAVYAKPIWEEPLGDEECAPIYERCLETITPYECPRRDRDCLCKAWGNMVTCFEPCHGMPHYWMAKEKRRRSCA
ncbi:unnamed protein product [Fusarium equiseti]|uniref:Extracellular membrane protein CFEM domain-containing protein n=1 Tax=Fusarium equiseti TaxID=61235 RepID=A0A8J2IK77_FUSEQ|nr:unnamed protein product [Fusarium equiseti]